MLRTTIGPLVAIIIGLGLLLPGDPVSAGDDGLESALVMAGSNRPEIQKAIEGVPDSQRDAMKWLVERMPEDDLRTLDAEYLIENCRLAFAARDGSPWG